MVRARLGTGLVAGCLLLWSSAAASAAPTVDQMLSFQPKQQGVACSTPTPQEKATCTVELISDRSRPGSTGWLMKDSHGLPLRRFFDTNGDRKIDVWSYYQDGVEVYREVDTNFNGRPDQYRWLNAGGMKWGIDANEDGKIESWKVISAEEASQEVLQAVINKDFARLQALWITEPEMKALEMSTSEVARIREVQKLAQAKFQATCAKLTDLGDKTRWERLEAGVPQCLPADATGMKQDLMKYPRASILYDNNGKHEFLQTGEMIQVGSAWRVVDAPSPGDAPTEIAGSPNSTTLDPQLKKLLDELHDWDLKAPKGQDTPGVNAEILHYNLGRAEIIQKVLALVKAEEREQWVRQLADCYSAAAQSSPKNETGAYDQLVKLAQETAKNQPNSPLAAYVTFREMSADYAAKLANGPSTNFTQVQEQWLTRLAKFMQDYPQAEDAPDALMQLGFVSELVGKEMEAKKWYNQLVTNFPTSTLAPKAQGGVRRLEIEGKPLELGGQTASGAFNVASLKGKLVVVYYWASWNQQCVGDFARLKLLMSNYAGKGVELVCVNLDSGPPEADGLIAKAQVPGVQVFQPVVPNQPGGLEGPLAVQYGIQVLPNMFFVGKDGTVLSRTVQVATLEDMIKQQLK